MSAAPKSTTLDRTHPFTSEVSFRIARHHCLIVFATDTVPRSGKRAHVLVRDLSSVWEKSYRLDVKI